MSDIIERSLELSVVGVDEASDVLAAIADQVDDLQGRFETAFGGMTAYAEDSASTIGDSANVFIGPWVEQLTALDELAASTFGAISASMDTVVTSAAGAAGDVTAAWSTPFSEITAEAAATATDVDGTFTGMASDAAASGAEVESAWLGNLSTISEQAAATADEVDASLSAAGGTADASGSALAADWSANLDKVTTDAAAAAAKVDESLASAGAGSDASGSAVAADWSANLDKIAADADATAADVDAAFGSVGAEGNASGAQLAEDWSASLGAISDEAIGTAADVDAAFGSVGATQDVNGDALAADWSDALGKITTDAEGAAAGIDASFGSVGATADVNGDQLAVDWSGNFDKIEADAVAAAAKIDATFAGIGATGAETGTIGAGAGAGAAAAGGAAGGEEAPLDSYLGADTASSARSAEGGMLGGAGGLSTALLGLIGGSLTLGGASAGVGGIQNIGFLAEQMHESIANALATEMALAGVGSSKSPEMLTAKLESSLQKAALSGTPELQGQPVSLGLGREGIEPESLQALLKTGGMQGANAGLALLFGSPKAAADRLTGQDPTVQLAEIADALAGIKNANEKSQIVGDLFGTRMETSVLPLLEHFSEAYGGAQKTLSGGAGKEIAQMVTGELSASGEKGMMGYEESLKLGEIGLEAGLVKLTPALIELTKAIVDLEGWLAKHGSSIKETLTEPVHAIVNAATGKGGGTAGSGWEQALGAGGLEALIGTGYAMGLGMQDAVGWVKSEAGGLLGDIGIGGGTPSASAATLSSTRSTLASLGVNSAAQGQSMDAIAAAAEKYGINPEAMMAASYAESTLIPTSHQGGGGQGRGLFQFSPGTFQSDYRALYHQAPTEDASHYSPQVQAAVSAYAMHQTGVGASSNTAKAFEDIIQRFEKPSGDPAVPGSTGSGYAGDISRGTSFLSSLAPDLDKAVSDVKAKAPEIPKTTNDALAQMIAGVETHGKDFPPRIDAMMALAEGYLKTAPPKWALIGTDLIKGLEQGLEAEVPTLHGEAQKIADDLEATIKSALRVHSPSEMTAEIGEMLTAGLAVGMGRGSRAVNEASAAAGLGAVRALAPSGAAAGGTQTIHIEVPVILDGHEIGRASSEWINNQAKLVQKFSA